ncbi:MAG: GNAT family N-acetyltransferase [Acidobacteriota bacterium]
MKNDLELRLATTSDVATLADLGARTFRDAFAADNDPDDLERYLATAFSPAQVARELADPGATFLLACDPGAERTPLGYVKLQAGGRYPCLGGRRPVELVRLYVESSAIGTGCGSALMAACLAEARRQGFDRLWLGVWEHNPRAIRFYERWHFEVVGDHEFLLGSDRQRDLLMERPTAEMEMPTSSPA